MNNEVYIQVDHIAIGSSLENMFMNELQRIVKPTFVKEIKQCKQYVGDKTNLYIYWNSFAPHS